MRRLKTVSVTGLLGRFDHDITIDDSWSFVILHGPNGIGKTRLLEIISNTFAFNTQRLFDAPFRSAAFTFSDGTRLALTKRAQVQLAFENAPIQDDEHRARRLVYELDGVEDGPIEWEAVETPASSIRDIERYLPVDRIAHDLWEDANGDVLSLNEVIFRYSDHLPFDTGQQEPPPGSLVQFLRSFDVHLIETQRLLTLSDFRPPRSPNRKRPERVPTVAQFAEDLARRIRETLALNSRTSQLLDRTFPRRVMEQEPPEGVTDAQIQHRYEEQLDLRRRLADISVLDSSADLPLPAKSLQAWQRRVLWTYLEDSDKKLETFSWLLGRIDLLREIVNSRFLFKELVIDAEKGFRFVSDDEQGSEIGPLALSSGEQHELVLLYDLLFNVRPNSLVLVDEPEISLHVSWQQEFLNDIQRIADLTDLQFVIATHSPQVVHNWVSRAVALYQVGDGSN